MTRTNIIALRTGSGTIKKYVPISGKVVIGQRLTHNRDASFTHVIAAGLDGIFYETKSYGGGYRVARDQADAQTIYLLALMTEK
jgi:hypothetical protein